MAMAKASAAAGDGEDEYIVLDFGTDGPLLESCESYKLIGLETPTPFIELGGRVYQGQHVTALGTDLVYSKSDPTGNVIAVATKRIRFTRVELIPKDDGQEEREVGTSPSTSKADLPSA